MRCWSCRSTTHYLTGRAALATLVAITLALTSGGCTAPRAASFGSKLPEPSKLPFDTVSVFTSAALPKSNFETFAKSRPAGAGKGAAAGAVEGVRLGLESAARGGAYGVLLLPFMMAAGVVIGSVTGGIVGAVESVPAAKAEEVESAIRRAIAQIEVQEKFARSLVVAGESLTEYGFRLSAPDAKDEEAASNPSGGATSELSLHPSIESLGFWGGGGKDPAVSLFMTASVRVLEARTGRELYSGPAFYVSPPHRFSVWARDDAALLRTEFEAAYSRLAEQTIESLFLVHDFHLDSVWATVYHCMLKPYDPPLALLGFFTRERMFARVASPKPTFTWEAFPRSRDVASDKDGVLARVSDVAYDLRIWKCGAENEKELTPVYDRRAVPVTERLVSDKAAAEAGAGKEAEVQAVRVVDHALEIELEPKSRYYWSVRARFKLDGRPRVTRWSYSRIPWPPELADPCLADAIPPPNFYRFETP